MGFRLRGCRQEKRLWALAGMSTLAHSLGPVAYLVQPPQSARWLFAADLAPNVYNVNAVENAMYLALVEVALRGVLIQA